jgi:hypothetical protein
MTESGQGTTNIEGDGVTLWNQPEPRKSYGFAISARHMCGMHADEIWAPDTPDRIVSASRSNFWNVSS